MIVRIEQYKSPCGDDVSSPPLPLNHGFTEGTAYPVYGMHREAGELYLVLVNDQDEIWSISNRHCRVICDKPIQEV